MCSVRRVIVGVSGSPSTLEVLRYAQHLARDLDATLVRVLAWLPPDADLADRRTSCVEPRRLWDHDARQRLKDALKLAWGEPPADLPVRPSRPCGAFAATGREITRRIRDCTARGDLGRGPGRQPGAVPIRRRCGLHGSEPRGARRAYR